MQHIPKSIVVDWLNTIWTTDLPPYSKYLACYLRKFMNSQQDMAWPSYSRICCETGLSKASVAKYLAKLESEGWLLRDRGSKGKNTIYMASFPANIEQATSLAGELVRDPTSMRDRLTSMRAKPEVVRHTDTNKQSNKQVNNQYREKTKGRSLVDDLTDRSWAD